MPTTHRTRKYPEEREIPIMKYFLGMLIIIVIGATIMSAIVIVPAGYKGVHTRFGAVTETVFDQGLHLITPYIEGNEMMDVRTVKYEALTDSASKDLQKVSTTVALNYHLKPEKVLDIWVRLKREYQFRVIEPAIQEAVKASTARFDAEELITKRPEVKDDIELGLKQRLAEYGIALDTLSIINFEFSAEFNQAIEAKVTALQKKLQAENDLLRIIVEKEQRITEAQGKAEALRIEGEALKSNAKLVSLRWIEKWNGVMPQIVAGGDQQFIWDVTGD